MVISRSRCIPVSTPKPKIAPSSPIEQRVDHRVRRRGGMDVERLPGIGERAEDRVELGIVEVFALGVAVDLHALEAQLARAAADFGGRPFRVLRRHGGQADEAVGMRGAAFGQIVVGARGDALGLGQIEHRLHAGRGQREHRLVDAIGIHVGQPPLAQVEQAVHDLRGAFGRRLGIEAPQREHALVGRAIAHHAQIDVDLFARGEGFLGGDAQIAAVAAGPEGGHWSWAVPFPKQPGDGHLRSDSERLITWFMRSGWR
jgi:hypothetical protein